MYIDKYWGNYIGDTDDSLTLLDYLEEYAEKPDPLFVNDVFYDWALERAEGNFRTSPRPLTCDRALGGYYELYFAIDLIIDLSALYLESSRTGYVDLEKLKGESGEPRYLMILAHEDTYETLKDALMDFIEHSEEYDLSSVMPDEDREEMVGIVKQLWNDLFGEADPSSITDMTLEEKLQYWHNKEAYQQIIDTLEAIPDEERGYRLTGLLARAYNNLAEIGDAPLFDKAIALLEATAEEGREDPNWHFRMGYALYCYEGRDAEAVPYFQRVFELIDDSPETQAFWSDAKYFLEEAQRYAAREQAQNQREEQGTTATPVEYDPKRTVDGKSFAPFDGDKLLLEMYRDPYYPNFLVDKIKELLVEVVSFIASGEHSYEQIQEALSKAVIGVNDLQEEFDENDSEIETVAREAIADSVYHILLHYGIEIEIEQAIRGRDW